MRRREVVAPTAAGVWSSGLLAQQRAKIARIGYLPGVSRQQAARFVEAFRQRLQELGYVDGQSMVIEQRWAEGDRNRLPPLALAAVEIVGRETDEGGDLFAAHAAELRQQGDEGEGEHAA